MKHYYIKDNRIWMANEKMPVKENRNFHFTLSQSEKNEIVEKEIKQWIKSLQPCEIIKSELDKIINHYIQEYSSTSNPIEVTDIVTDNDNIITFKKPSKSDETNESVAIDRLVGWFRKRVSIKDYEVDYLKFVMREYNSLNKK